MIRAFLLSIRQLGDPAIVSVLAKSLALTLALFAALGVGLYFLIEWAFQVYIHRSGDALAGLLAMVIDVVAAWLLFRVVAMLVIGLFADQVVAAVERRHYPAALAGVRRVGIDRSLAMGMGSAVRALVVNLLATPVYVALLFTAVGPAIAFFIVNGWLLGRDLGDMVAVRHMDDATIRGWRKATAGTRFALGLVVTGLFVVPLVNLVAPILGAAMATHLFHGRRR